MKKVIANLIALITVSPILLFNSSVLAQERNFKSSCGYSSTSGVEYSYEERGKCTVKTYVQGDYLIVEVKSSWKKGEKETLRLENKPSCKFWSSTEGNDCKGEYWYDDNTGWSYITATEDRNSFGYSLGNAYMFSYDGPLLRPPSNSTTQNTSQANSDATQTCSSALENVAKQINKYGTPTDVYTDKNANEHSVGNPSNKTGQITFSMGALDAYDKVNSVVENILNSFQLQQGWADYLVKNCNNLAAVTFAKVGSGWNNQFAIQTNGQMKARECIFPGEDYAKAENDPWNYTGCD
jgi:hypothetical protein